MANHFFSTNRGTGRHSLVADTADITTGSATTAGNDVELRVADAASLTKKDVRLLVEKLLSYIEQQSDFPII